jgi:AbrB family looped-hinge helix DNA binding protein
MEVPMELARITSKGQMTIPKKVRDAAHLDAGDVVTVTVEDGRVLIRKVLPGGDEYLRAVQGALGEWNSPEDDEAWRGL